MSHAPVPPPSASLAPVILAAGASTRLGQPKALALLGGRAAIDRMLDALLDAGLEDPIIVTGAHHKEIRAHLQGRLDGSPFTVCHNPNWALGRTGGVQLAVGERGGRDLLVWPADVPLVAAGTIRALVTRFYGPGEGAEDWLAPSYASGERLRHGHPVLIRSALGRQALSLGPGAPLRELRALAQAMGSMACQDVSILDDLDTQEDLQRMELRLGRAPE